MPYPTVHIIVQVTTHRANLEVLYLTCNIGLLPDGIPRQLIRPYQVFRRSETYVSLLFLQATGRSFSYSAMHFTIQLCDDALRGSVYLPWVFIVKARAPSLGPV